MTQDSETQASEEIWKLCERLTGRHDGPWAEGRACGHCDLIRAVVDRVSGQALEKAAALVEEHQLHIDIGSEQDHIEAPFRCCVAQAIRALIPGGK